MDYHVSNHDPASRIILAIIQEAGGSYHGKTRLFKVFYSAHLYFWEDTATFLTDHPIVHMPNGPGIDDGDNILCALESTKKIRRGVQPVGPHREDVYTLCASDPIKLTHDETQAIRRAIEWVGEKSATQISKESHELSRTWRLADEAKQSGRPLHIYLDSMSEEEWDRLQAVSDDVRNLFQ